MMMMMMMMMRRRRRRRGETGEGGTLSEREKEQR
jgi:hypothetical protein